MQYWVVHILIIYTEKREIKRQKGMSINKKLRGELQASMLAIAKRIVGTFYSHQYTYR